MPDFRAVFADLSSILRPYADKLDVKTDTPDHLYVDTHHVMKNKKPLFFGAVQVKKKYVSFYLMPVYMEPALLDSASAALRGRMQGKSCFNFTTQDADLFSELAGLVDAGYIHFQEQGYI